MYIYSRNLGKFIYIFSILKAFLAINLDHIGVFVLAFPSIFIILSADCKKCYSGVTDERLNSLATLHLHKHKEFDIDGIVT